MRGQKFIVVNKNFAECYCLYLPVTENKITLHLLYCEHCFLKMLKQGCL